MKYAVFWTALVVGVPAMAWAGFVSKRLRGWLVAALIFAPALGVRASINFVSHEHYRGPDRGFEVTLADLIVCALILIMVSKFPARVRWLPHNTALFAAFFVVAAASAWAAPDRLLAAFSLAKMVRVYALYWCAANLLRIGTSKRYLCSGFVAAASYVALVSVQQKYLQGIYRVPGPFDHSNTVPLYLNLVIPVLLLFSMLATREQLGRMVTASLAVIGVLAAVLATGSRVGIALAGGATLVMLVIGNVRLRSRRIRIYSLAALLVMLGGGMKATDSIIDRFLNAPEASGAAREEFNKAARLMAADNPLGVGINNFSRALSDVPGYRRHIEVMETEAQAGVAHHIYWLTAAETGYIGVAVFVLLQAQVLVLTMRGALRTGSLDSLFAAAFLVGLSTLHLSGFFEWGFRITPVTYQFAICAGFAMAFSDRALNRAGRGVLWRRRPPTLDAPAALASGGTYV